MWCRTSDINITLSRQTRLGGTRYGPTMTGPCRHPHRDPSLQMIHLRHRGRRAPPPVSVFSSSQRSKRQGQLQLEPIAIQNSPRGRHDSRTFFLFPERGLIPSYLFCVIWVRAEITGEVRKHFSALAIFFREQMTGRYDPATKTRRQLAETVPSISQAVP